MKCTTHQPDVVCYSVLCMLMPVFRTLYQSSSIPKVHSTSFCKDSSHCENLISPRFMDFLSGRRDCGRPRPIPVVNYDIGTLCLWYRLFHVCLREHGMVELNLPSRRCCMKPSKRTRVFHSKTRVPHFTVQYLSTMIQSKTISTCCN